MEAKENKNLYICAYCKQEFGFKDITKYNNKYYCLSCIEHKVVFINKGVDLCLEDKKEKS